MLTVCCLYNCCILYSSIMSCSLPKFLNKECYILGQKCRAISIRKSAMSTIIFERWYYYLPGIYREYSFAKIRPTEYARNPRINSTKVNGFKLYSCVIQYYTSFNTCLFQRYPQFTTISIVIFLFQFNLVLPF